MNTRGYSDQMARRIRCLQIGSFDCLIRGGVFTEDEARAILPYLEIRCSVDGYCIACARARFTKSDSRWLRENEASPADSAERVLRVRTGQKGFVYHRHDEDDIVLFWSTAREEGYNELRTVFEAATEELESRHRVTLSYAVGSWQSALIRANESLEEARSLLARGGSIAANRGCSNAGWTDEIERFGADRMGLCANEPVRSIQAYILEHFRDPNLALSRIAARFRLTETYLSQLFKEQTGVNYSVFLEQIRVEEARLLLEQNDLTISEVASQVGYQINSTFYRAFRRMYGVSPTTFRNRVRGRLPARGRASDHAVAG